MHPEGNSSRPETTPWTAFIWWLSTADAHTLRECRAEHERYRIIGLSVLVTWIFATIAWGYFFSTMLEDDLLIYGLALFFGFAIMTIDRNLIAAMQKGEGGKGWLPFAFRILLAFTIGLFISQPIVLMLFRKDVATQMALNKEKKLQEYRQQAAALDAGAQGDIDRHIAELKARLDGQQREVQAREDAYIRETDGTGGSGRVGEASIARVKRNAYQQAMERYDALKRETEPQLALYAARRDSLRSEAMAKEARYTATFTDGFLAQVEALSDLTRAHAPVRSRYRLIIFIITLIEVMPVLSKWLLPKGEYEERMAQRQALGIHNARLRSEKEKALEQHFTERSTETDRRSIDEFFAQSAAAKEDLARDVIGEPLNGSGSYTSLWNRYRERVFTKKEM